MKTKPRTESRRVWAKSVARVMMFLAGWLIAVEGAFATEIFVRDCGDDTNTGLLRSCGAGTEGPKRTIQGAIDEAESGDVIRVYPGDWSGDGNRQLDFGGKEIVVRSDTLDPATTTIDCGGLRAVIFQTAEPRGSVLRGFTIKNGGGSVGGAIRCSAGTSPTIRDCVFFENEASPGSQGGAIVAIGATPLILGCVFESNRVTGAFGGGAAAVIQGSDVEFRGCSFRNNTAGNGGAIRVGTSSRALLVDCTIEDCSSDDNGGAIFAVSASVDLDGCTVQRNAAGISGGFAYLAECDLTVHDTRIERNTASRIGGQGGAVYSTGPGASLVFTDSRVEFNESHGGGGAVFSSAGAVEMGNVDVRDNETRDGRGGGLHLEGGAIALLHEVEVASNESRVGGGGIYLRGGGRIHAYDCEFADNVSRSGRGGAFRITEASTLSARDCRIHGNSASRSGGGIAATDSSTVFLAGNRDADAWLIDNNAAAGGGLWSEESEATLVRCVVTGNRATSSGGAIDASEGSLTVRRSRFELNEAPQGGAIASAATDVELTRCDFRDNRATGTGGGGAVLHVDTGKGLVRHAWNDFIDNEALVGGGGAVSLDASAAFHNCAFIENRASSGGAVASLSTLYRELDFASSIFNGNRAEITGGALSLAHLGIVKIGNCTLAQNAATDPSVAEGGAIWTLDTELDIDNSIFWRNEDRLGRTFESEITRFFGWEIVSIDHSCFSGSACPPESELRPMGTNIRADPFFTDPDGEDNVPGNEDDDLTLRASASALGGRSPCIDEGDGASVPLDVLDLDGDGVTGESAMFDFLGTYRFAGPVDMGAYESIEGWKRLVRPGVSRR